MGKSSYYTREGILESLLELYDSGIPLRIKDLKSAGKGGLLAAINRDKRRSKHLVFFNDLHDAREQLAMYVAEKLNNQDKAESIREFNRPKKREKYNKLAIKMGLLEYFEAGGELTGDALQKTWMHGAIYYNHGGRTKTYGSLFDAREALALFLESKKRFDDAERVRQYNLPPERKMPESERDMRRADLIERLHKKVEAGEDLGHRAQQKTDRSFVNGCTYYFGTYSNVFSAAGLNFADFANRPLNKSPEEYFSLFLDLLESAGSLQRGILVKLDKNLIDRINEYESGYFQALQKARVHYSGEMNFDMVRTIDCFFASDEKSQRDILAKKKAAERSERERSIVFFDCKLSYDVSDLFPSADGKLTGREIMHLAESSGEWLQSVSFSEKMYMDRSNIKNLFHQYPERILKFEFGKNQKYLFHTSIIDDEKNEGKIFDRVVEREINKIGETSSQKKYFRGIIFPKLYIRLKDKNLFSPEQIKWWFYEFGGIRVIEGYVNNIIKDLPEKDRENALNEMNQLCSDYLSHREENVHERLLMITAHNPFISKNKI